MSPPSTPGPSAARRAVEIVSPDEDGVRFYLTRYKPFRLLALRESPASFSSKYEREAAFADSEWVQRVTNPKATTFVAVEGDDRTVLSSAALLGPLPIPDDPEIARRISDLPPGLLHWQMAAVYTRPEARRTGLAREVLGSVWKWAVQKAVTQGSSCVVTVEVLKGNHGATRMYEGIGFSVVGEHEGTVHMVRCVGADRS